MKKTLILLITISIFQNFIDAQCPPYPADIGCGLAEPNCVGIDGYCNTLVPQTQNTEPIPDCGGTAVINNDDWIAFYAGTSTISIQIIPSNCIGAGSTMGLQAGLYATCDADGGVNGDGQASDAIAVQCGCTISTINMTYSNFVVGQIYYLLIDGCGGDICDYEIDVLQGNTSNPDILDQTGDIQSDSFFCTGDISIFSIESVENASYYSWSIDSTASILNGQGTTEIEVVIEAEGTIEICVTATNGCSTGTESCTTVNSMGIVQSTTFAESFCEGDSIEFEGQLYSESGFYSSVYTGVNGCDSILNLDLTVGEVYEIFIDTTVCETSSFEVGDSIYTENGTYENFFTSSEGCDSVVYLDLVFGTNSETNLETFVCDNETITIWGNEVSPPATLVNYLQSSVGCDSMVTIDLIPLPTYTTTIDTMFDPGGIYNGTIYTSDTTFFENHVAENGCDSLVFVIITIESVSISLPAGIDQLNIFPNPTNNQFIVQLELNESLELRLDIYNTFGKKVSNIALDAQFSQGNHNIELDASQLAVGTYFLHFQTGKGNIVKRLVVAK